MRTIRARFQFPNLDTYLVEPLFELCFIRTPLSLSTNVQLEFWTSLKRKSVPSHPLFSIHNRLSLVMNLHLIIYRPVKLYHLWRCLHNLRYWSMCLSHHTNMFRKKFQQIPKYTSFHLRWTTYFSCTHIPWCFLQLPWQQCTHLLTPNLLHCTYNCVFK